MVSNGRFEGWPHVLGAQQFTRPWLEEVLFPQARRMQEVFMMRGDEALRGRRLVSLFYQPSTRTRGSFQMAMSYRGGEIPFQTENAREFSSAKKGESLKHTIQNWNRYFPDPFAGAIVLRHYMVGAAELAAEYSMVPIINAGDGPGQHPTQALLDIFTLYEKLGGVDGKTVALMGDLKNGRTARSLACMLSKFNDVKLFLISSERSRMKDDIKQHLQKHGVWYAEHNDIRELAPQLDAVYVIRDQKEYANGWWGSHLWQRACKGLFLNSPKNYLVIDRLVMDLLPSHAVIAHPLPIDSSVMEIRPEVEDDPRVICLRDQVAYGLFVRMALLPIILSEDTAISQAA